MTTLTLNTSTVKKLKESITPRGCYSVEFSVDKPHPLYQFKIWRSESNPMFVVVKEDSKVLPKLKTGSVFNMTYYSEDTLHPKKKFVTRIGTITNEQEGRFKGHYTIDLVPIEN